MKVETFLPVFDGFYYSIWSDLIDDGVDFELEVFNDNIDDCDVEIDFEGLAKSIYYKIMEYIDDVFPGLVLHSEFQRLVMPKYYNYSSDNVYIEVELDKDKFMNLILDNEDLLRELIKDNYTSHSGFISSYPNDLDDWIEEVKNNGADLDHMVGALLDMIIRHEYEDYIHHITEDIYVGEFIDFKNKI